MKKLILVCAMLPGLMYADVCALVTGGYGMGNTFYGPTNCGEGSVDSVSVMGPLGVQGTNIKTMTVNGPLHVVDANIGAMFVNGPIQAENSNIGDISVSGNVTLNATRAGNIIVKGAPTFGNYKVKLDDGTTVKSVTFEAGEGVVVESSGSSVTGKVMGGQLQAQVQ